LVEDLWCLLLSSQATFFAEDLASIGRFASKH
jgi:hypothetical protein